MRRYSLICSVVFLVVFFLNLNTASAITDTVGGTGTIVNGWQTIVAAQNLTASSSGTLSTIGINIQGSTGDYITLAIYANNGTAPSTLLGQSSNTLATTGWNDLAVAGVSIVSGTNYYLVSRQTVNLFIYSDNGGLPNLCDDWTTAGTWTGAYYPFANPWNYTCADVARILNMRIIYSTTDEPPKWTDNTTTPADFQLYPTSPIWFNISWTDDNTMSTALLGANFSGSFVNYTMSNDTTSHFFYQFNNSLNQGYYQYIFYANDSANQFNSTQFQGYTVIQSDFTLTDVYDELTMSPICYNLAIYNSTFSYNATNHCGLLNTTFASLPKGIATISISNSSYVTRYYIVNVSTGSFVNFVGYLLAVGSGVDITSLVYQIDDPSNVLVSVLKFVNSSWTVIDQKYSDTQGKGFFYLHPYSIYQITAIRGTSSTIINPYYPNPDFILYIPMNASYPTSRVWIWNNITASLSPNSTYFTKGAATLLTYTLADSAADLQYYALNITRVNGTTKTLIYGNNQTASPTGGTISVYMNDTNYNASSYIVSIFFKRSGYDVWTFNRTYTPSTVSGFNLGFSIPDFLSSFKSGGLGITSSFTLDIIVLFTAMVCGAFVGKATSPMASPTFGGSIAFIAVLGVAAAVGLFNWIYVLLMVVIAIGINLARSWVA